MPKYDITMIQLVDRRTALRNPHLKRAVSSLQNGFYQDWLSLAETEEERQLLEEEFDYREPQERPTYSKVRVFYHPSVNLTDYSRNLGASFHIALQSLGVASVYCLSHVRKPLFGNLDNNDTPLKKTYQKLASITKDTDYREGFQIDLESLEEFTEILFWISRCDPAAPEYILISPENDLFVSYLCKYGNLHIDFYEAQSVEEVIKELSKAGLEEWSGREYDRFSHNGIIEGRKLKI